jgi:hypothetical protein
VAFVAALSPLLRAGASCVRGDEGMVVASAGHGHGDTGSHEHDRGRDGPDAAEHCATSVSCVSTALGAEAAVSPPETIARAAPAIADARAPLAIARAPEPPPPRA